ncbi:MAG: PqqD family protein, partial [Methanosarcinales archaeon]
LNKTGSGIWELCDGKHSVLEISRAIMDKFHIDEQTCLLDTIEFLTSLKRYGLINC